MINLIYSAKPSYVQTHMKPLQRAKNPSSKISSQNYQTAPTQSSATMPQSREVINGPDKNESILRVLAAYLQTAVAEREKKNTHPHFPSHSQVYSYIVYQRREGDTMKRQRYIVYIQEVRYTLCEEGRDRGGGGRLTRREKAVISLDRPARNN